MGGCRLNILLAFKALKVILTSENSIIVTPLKLNTEQKPAKIDAKFIQTILTLVSLCINNKE